MCIKFVYMLWFNFILGSNSILFPLFQTHYHQITITKTKDIKFEPRIKLNHIYTYIYVIYGHK